MINEFQQQPDLIYLNHAAVAPWPARTQEAVCQFAEENCRLGATHYPKWLQKERHLREQIKQLINAPDALDIALLKNTSEGLSVIAHGLDWQAGDEIIISNQEFPSNRIVWESLKGQGVHVQTVDITGEHPEQAIMEACTPKTRLIALSSVQYASGIRLNLKPIGQHCRQREILFVVDAIQSIGAVNFDCQDIFADFVVADGHKWMLGPEGLALFYSRAEIRDQIALKQFGWHMVEKRGDYDRLDWQTDPTALRFECGSPNMLGIHALSASLSLLLEMGMEQVEAQLHQKVDYLIQGLSTLPGIEFLSPTEQSKRSGIVTVRFSQLDSEKLQMQLKDHNVVCAYRGGGVRFSPHFYTETARLDRLFGILKDLC